jgi:hypothetical protein
MESIKKVIKLVDLVGYRPSIFYLEQNKFKTCLGGIITIIILILTILATIGFGQDIFKRQNPTVLTNNNFIEPTLDVGQTTVIGYRLFYTGGVRIPDLDKLVDVFVLHSVFRPDLSSTTVKRYEVIKCNEAEAYQLNMLNLTSLIGKPEDYYCVPNNITFALMGKYGAPINNHMHLRIGICKNSTQNNNRCYPEPVIRQKLASFFVSFLYKDSYIDAKDYSNPVKYYVTSNTLKSSSNNFRQDAYLYKNVSFCSDSGLILPDLQTTNHIQLDSILSSTSGDEKTEVFTNVIIGLTNIKINYQRSYIKIQDLSAQVGGIIKFFLLFFEFVLSFYSYVPFLESLYGSIFEYKEINDNIQLEIKKQNIKKVNEIQFVKVNVNEINNAQANVNLNKNYSYDFKEKISNRKIKPTSYSSFQIFCRCCKLRNSYKYAYFEKISKHYERNYDVMQIILNSQKTSILFDFTFNDKEKEILELHKCNNFFIDQENDIKRQIKMTDNNISSSMIFERLKIPRNLLSFNN